jgi:hypothetical protein
VPNTSIHLALPQAYFSTKAFYVPNASIHLSLPQAYFFNNKKAFYYMD